jgi:hypothetical protein
MTISQHAQTFAGLPVQPYDPDARKTGGRKCVYRLGGLEHEARFAELLDGFLDRHGGTDLTALVLGAWHYEDMTEGLGGGGAGEVVRALVANRDRMPNLRALFVGDITFEECEISWISYGDVSPLLPAFPKLEEFRIRGASKLTFGKIRHDNLRSFAIESGGLPEPLLREVWAAELPRLESLELWLGTVEYGGIETVAPLGPLLAGGLFTNLRHLGLRNCAIADEVARALAASPLLGRLEGLDLSLGSLSEAGAEALLTSPAVSKLKKLDLHHHFISPAFVEALGKLPVEVDVSDVQQPDFHSYDGTTHVYRYIVASE